MPEKGWSLGLNYLPTLEALPGLATIQTSKPFYPKPLFYCYLIKIKLSFRLFIFPERFAPFFVMPIHITPRRFYQLFQFRAPRRIYYCFGIIIISLTLWLIEIIILLKSYLYYEQSKFSIRHLLCNMKHNYLAFIYSHHFVGLHIYNFNKITLFVYSIKCYQYVLNIFYILHGFINFMVHLTGGINWF